jgi:phage repressor protein C with HTH and peptisase S24 domain
MKSPEQKKQDKIAFGKRLAAFRIYKELSPALFSQKCKFKSPSTLRQYESGEFMPKDDVRKDIQSAFPDLNMEWLINNNGQMLLSAEPMKTKITKALQNATKELPENENNGDKPKKITFYDVNFMAGTGMAGFGDGDDSPATQEIVLPEFKDCDFAAKVYGDSMMGKYEHGDILFGRTLPPNFLPHIRYGEAYYIVTTEEKQLAYVRKSNDKTKITLRKHNTYYEDFEININDIRMMIHVKGKGKFERLTY